MSYDVIGNPAGWLGDKIGWWLKDKTQGISLPDLGSSVPPEGTSAHKAYQFYQEHGTPAPGLIEALTDSPDLNNPTSRPYSSSAKTISHSRAPIAQVDFINAELAKHYGMSKATAYQEALSNTAYQRAVKDMKDAGLNPAVMFGSGRAQSANASIYASDQMSGGGGSGRRYGGRSSGNGKLFSPGLYYGISTAAGLVTAIITRNPANYWIGSAGAQGVMGTLDAIF